MSVNLFGTRDTIWNNFIVLNILIMNILGFLVGRSTNYSLLSTLSQANRLLISLLMNKHSSKKDLVIEFQKFSYISSELNEKLPLQKAYLKSALNRTKRNLKLNEFYYYKTGRFIFFSFFLVLCCFYAQKMK